MQSRRWKVSAYNVWLGARRTFKTNMHDWNARPSLLATLHDFQAILCYIVHREMSLIGISQIPLLLCLLRLGRSNMAQSLSATRVVSSKPFKRLRPSFWLYFYVCRTSLYQATVHLHNGLCSMHVELINHNDSSEVGKRILSWPFSEMKKPNQPIFLSA